uniref:Ig-like domain-containing protein n=1 Tax=Cyprinodon variegatus TaxID=28743 RepID=A0A3Q2CKV1_CYPVA
MFLRANFPIHWIKTAVFLFFFYAVNLNVITVAVGENVTLSCKRNRLENEGSLFWIKLVPGNMPEVLGKTFTFDYDPSNINSRISTMQEPGSFVLHIAKAIRSDLAFYFCLKSKRLNATFLNGTFLRIKGPKPDYTAVIQDSLSDTVHEGDSVNLQCSIFAQSEKKTCPEESRVFWLRFSSVEKRPSLIYAQKEVEGKCEHNPDPQSGQSCVFSFVKDNISFLDTGTYYCALAACGRVVFGNGTKLEFQGYIMFLQHIRNIKTFFFYLFGIDSSLSFHRYYYVHFNFANFYVTFPAFLFSQRNGDDLVYSKPTFLRMKADRADRVKARRREDTIYSDVRAFDGN